jgi:hypothetical protein
VWTIRAETKLKKIKIEHRRRDKHLNLVCGDLGGDTFTLTIPYFDMTTPKKAEKISKTIRKKVDRALRYYTKKGIEFGEGAKLWRLK